MHSKCLSSIINSIEILREQMEKAYLKENFNEALRISQKIDKLIYMVLEEQKKLS
ncbi:MAG: aspartyl-phosphate phosphatase Spo0E family protein [Halanaerobiales bacterium]|nr:aspartyl-phosphate phosphatase Spo0E family protein [Halanaerobiales bacterium]